MADVQIPVRRVTLNICELCLAGDGGHCYVPGCAFWMGRAPVHPLWDENGHYFATALRQLDEEAGDG